MDAKSMLCTGSQGVSAGAWCSVKDDEGRRYLAAEVMFAQPASET